MIYDRYWTIIIFVINVTIIILNGVTLAFFQSCSKTPDLRDLFITFANDIEIYGADSLNKTRPIPNISSLNLLGRDPKYVLISSLQILNENYEYFLGLSRKKLSAKFGNF